MLRKSLAAAPVIMLCAGITLLVPLASAADGPAAASSPDSSTGKSLFQLNCGSCHTLTAARTEGALGPDLDALSTTPITEAAIAVMVAQGDSAIGDGGSSMPAFQGLLSAAQIADVATFVYRSTHPAVPAPPVGAVERVMVTIGRPAAADCRLSRSRLETGKIVFTVVNRGRAPQAFAFDGRMTRAIGPDGTATLTVEVSKPGQEPYSCTDSGKGSLEIG